MLMTIDTRAAALAIFIISLLTVAGAWIFQLAGYPPCPLCLMQRWAYYAAIPLSLVVFAMIRRDLRVARGLLVIIGLIFVANAVFGAYHAGIEWKFWPGPATCAGGSLSGGLPDLEAPVVACEDAALRIIGLSLAGWNVLISVALALVAFAGTRHYGSSSVSQ